MEKEQIYTKRFYLTENVTAIWDDFFAMGAQKEEKILEINYGPFKNEFEADLKKEELEKLRRNKESGVEELCKKLNISEPTATLRSSVPPYDERSYGVDALVISYKIVSRFEPFEN